MLKVWFDGFKNGCIKDPSSFFNLHKKKEWFSDKRVIHVIKEIDNVDVIKDECLVSPEFGGMSPERLSSGCKAIILLLMNPSCNVYASRCGDNCAKYILELAEYTDVVITLHHAMNFPRDFVCEILDNGKVVTTRADFLREYLNWKYKKEDNS